MNINDLMKQAKREQDKIEKAKKELHQRDFIIEKQGLKIVLGGDISIKSIDINEILIDPSEKDLLEDILIIAINEGIEKIKEAEEGFMPKMRG